MSDALQVLGLLIFCAAAAIIGVTIGGLLIGVGIGGLLVGVLVFVLGVALSDGEGFIWRGRS